MSYRYGVAVIGNSKNIMAFHADRRGNYVAQVEVIDHPGDHISHHSPGCRVYWADSSEAANALAKSLTEDFPTYQFVVFESKTMYTRPPGQMTTAEFSDKGLLPK